MKFVSDLKEFIYPEDATSRVMESAINNGSSVKGKILWFILTGALLIGCSYLGYRFGGGLVGDDD